ncbi:cation:dicarboxylase symporter family transporter, partial [Vibrio breoganii]
MSFQFIVLSVLFLGFYAVLSNFKKQKKTFNYRVLSALVGGLLFGGVIQLSLGVDHSAVASFGEFISVFGKGYIKLLQMIVIPLVFVAMVSSVMNVDGAGALSKIAPKIIGLLIFTVAISAIIGVASIYIFGIDANTMVTSVGSNGAIEARGDSLISTQESMSSNGLAALALSIIPANIFDMLTGSERTSTLSTVLFGMGVVDQI